MYHKKYKYNVVQIFRSNQAENVRDNQRQAFQERKVELEQLVQKEKKFETKIIIIKFKVLYDKWNINYVDAW